MELQEAILKRRAVRRFTEDAVTDQELEQLFEAVRWSPSWSNSQVWEFVVARDRELIQKLTETYRMPKGLNPATKCSQTASALIVMCAKTGISGCYEGKESTKHANWYMFDLGIATQTLCLKAHAMGLATVVVGLLDHDACNKLVALPVRLWPTWCIWISLARRCSDSPALTAPSLLQPHSSTKPQAALWRNPVS